MERCLQLARHGLGTTRPNPSVGCVIVNNDRIIGEGFTSPYGGPHAEVNAIGSVQDKSALSTSTLYVTLEPCSHHGKTPPCSDKIIESGIKNVVIGCQDPNLLVNSAGIEALKRAGCKITLGILEEKCRKHHKRFICFHSKKRPYVILKWAQSSDGFIAPETRSNRSPVWISSTRARQLVHKWRAEEQAILVGRKTVEEDNPSLTTRNWKGLNPYRIIIDPASKLSSEMRVFDSEADTLRIDKSMINFKQHVAAQILNLLYTNGINSVLVEGGSQTIQTFIDEGLWDEARVFYSSNKLFSGLKAPYLNNKKVKSMPVGTDTLKIYERN